MIDPRPIFEQYGQGQVFRFFNNLSAEKQHFLTRQAASIDLNEINHLVETLVKNPVTTGSSSQQIEPAYYIPVSSKKQTPLSWQQAQEVGETALREGQVAAFTVAGGQGTRLGFSGPKGTFPISPVSGKSLFQVFAQKLDACSQRYQHDIPWFIMTSEENHQQTQEFFQEHSWFGLNAENVQLFSQGTIPAVDQDGKILLADKHRIALSPDGHGGSLRALVRSGATQKMREQGINILSCFQVDNPLVKCIDPAFLGFHLNEKSQLSSKTIMKTSPAEKVGVFCEKDGRTCVIEYSDLSQQLQEQVESNGDLRFRAGSIAVHLFDRQLIEQLGGDDLGRSLPFHLARKKVSSLDSEGQLIENDAIKFEMFIFDALPFAEKALVMETLRQSEFSPVKNAEGNDSPESSRRDQLRQFARWFNAAGVELPCDAHGDPEIKIEISPKFADSKESFAKAWKNLSPRPDLKEGLVLEN